MPASTMSSTKAENGKLISAEGDAQLISTQLRLLPPSQNILILPSLLADLPEQNEKGNPDPRSFIRNVHTAFTERVTAARSFLQASTNSQPRLAFMNGGVVTARATCISYISKNYTDGSIEDAEAIFNDIVKDGVSGLMNLEVPLAAGDEASDTKSETDNENHMEGSSEEDHSVKAIQTAESIDHDTATLRESTPGSTTLDMRDDVDKDSQDERWKSSSQPYTPRPRDILFSNSDIVRTLVAIPEVDTKRCQDLQCTTQNKPLPTPPTTSRLSGHQAHWERGDDERASRHLSTCSMPQAVIFGEACIVEVQPTTGKRLRKAVSVDHFLTSDFTVQNLGLDTKRRQRSNSDRHLRSCPPPLDLLESFPAFLQSEEDAPLKASQMTIKEASRILLKLPPSPTTARRIYIDRGTNAREEDTQYSTLNESVIFEPVFPVVEDLVIHFSTGNLDPILDSVVLSYKNGAYPKFPDTLVTYGPPSPAISTSDSDSDSESDYSETYSKPGDGDSHRGLTPYSSNLPPWPRSDDSNRAPTALAPPTPSITPQSISNGLSGKFYAFCPPNIENVIEIQNSLRVILGLYFPEEEESYSQHLFPVIPEADRFWKPVFSYSDDISAHGDSTVDQILALGCEEGVDQNLFSQISGQVERLGMKRDGTNRSGRLDLRYLIANAMQTTAASASNQNRLSHKTDSKLLAELLIPHIEAYLAANNTVRLLILLYPADHLCTVISLRKLLGQKLFNIAGVIDSYACDPPSRIRPSSPTISHPFSSEAFAAPIPPPRSRNRPSITSSFVITQSPNSPSTIRSSPSISFSKADYLIPSIASDSEIATFLSGILAALIEVSSYYTPEPEPEEIIVERIVERFIEKPTLPVTTTSAYHPLPHGTTYASRNSSAKIAKLTGSDATIPIARFAAPEKGSYAPSIASTTMTMRTTGSKRWRNEDMGGCVENFYLEEEDSEDDDWDRMIMGRSGAKPPPKAPEGKKGLVVGSKKKALKWLGLA